MRNRVVFIIDMLNGFCKKGNLASPQFMHTIVPSLQKLIKNEMKNKNSIIYICDSHKENDEEFKIFPSHCIRNTWESEIIDELKTENMKIILKNRYSGFFNTELDKLIIKYLPDETDVIIGGNCTDICVHYTAEELRNRDYNVIISADCVDTYNLSEKKCKELGLSLYKAHPAYAINDFFLKKHFPDILGVKVIQRVDELYM